LDEKRFTVDAELEKVSYRDLVNDYGGDKEEKWPLPYKSTIVVPLTLMERQINNDEENTFIGTLCVDSLEKGVFDRGLDKIILQCLSEVIYIYYLAYLRHKDKTSNNINV